MLKTRTVQAVRDIPINEVIGHYIDLTKKGGNYVCKSPFTDEKTPSFTVFKRTNTFKCFSSGNGGDGIAFVMKHKNLEFIEAIHEIATDHGIPIEEEDLTPEQKEKNQKEYDEKKEVFKIMEYAKNHFLNNIIPSRWRQIRNFNSKILEKFQVGYGSGKTTLVEDAIKAGFSQELLKKAGLLRNVLDTTSTDDKKVWIQVDAYTDRVIFPILDTKGNTLAFTARYNGQDEKAPKYINSPGEVWDKSHILYGLYQAEKAIRKADKVFLVEGPTDVIRMHLSGLENTVCPCGTALTDEQCKLLYRFTDQVTIVPDNDQEKDDNPGLKAMKRSALLLLKHGFIVRVLIPGDAKSKKNTDPDSFLVKMKTDEQFGKWMDKETGYVDGYLTTLCITMASVSPELKSQAVTDMAKTLESVKETLYRNALYDSIGEVWSYFKKEYKLQKREANIVSTDIEKLKRDARDEYFKHKFLEEDGKYVSWDKGKKKDLSNFTFHLIFTVKFINENEELRKAVLSMTDVFNYRTLTVINVDDFCSAATFKKICRRKGDFLWKGKDEDLDNVYEKIFLNAPKAIELDRMGWNTRYSFWVWSNGIYYDGDFHPMDKYGLVQRNISVKSIDQFLKLGDNSQLIIEGKLDILNSAQEYLNSKGENEVQRMIDDKRISKVDFFYLPFGTALQIETSEEDKGNDFKKDIMLVIPEKGKEWTFDQWAAKIAELYGKNGWVMIAYYLASICHDIIYKINQNWFPLLFFFGRPKSGKSTAAKSLYQMFGEPPQKDGINLSSGSTPVAMGRYMNTLSNIPGFFNEYKNHISDKIKEVLKGLADGSGRLQGTRTAKGTTSISPRSGALICGQELPSSEAALMSRFIPLEFESKNRPSKSIYDAFKDIESTGIFRMITCKLLEFRHIFKNYKETQSEAYNSIREKCIDNNIEPDDRLLLNACTLLTPIKLFLNYTEIKFPFTYPEFEENMIAVITMSSQIQAESDEVDKFFKTLMSIIGVLNTGINESSDFEIRNHGTKKLLYLRYTMCYGKYAARAKTEGFNPMDSPGLLRYLKTHRSFIEETKSARICGTKTSAFIFDYEMLLSQDIDLQKSRIVTSEELAIIQAQRDREFEDLIKRLEPKKKYQTKELIKSLVGKIDDHITHDEFIHLCNTLNAKKSGIIVQKHDEDASIIYIERTNGASNGLLF